MRAPLFALCLAAIVSTGAQAQQPAPQAVPVGTVQAVRKPITESKTFVGRIQAVNHVDVQARVTGFLKEVQFKEGDTVAVDAPLYSIEPDQYDAAVQQATGDLLRMQGQYKNASLQRARAEELVRTNATSVATKDERVADEQTAQGNLIAAEAQLQIARTNLSYTKITSPIAGRVGKTNVTIGNVVGPNSGVLTQIVSVDPTYVQFPVSQREFLDIERHGGAQANATGLQVRLRFADGSEYDQLGRIDFIDVVVDRATDTVLARATIANPKGLLVDGQFVNVQVEGDKPVEKILVPQSALIADQEGVYVFIVDNGKAAIRRVKPGAGVGADVTINEGLNGGEQVVVQGMQTLRAGTPVLASPVPALAGG